MSGCGCWVVLLAAFGTVLYLARWLFDEWCGVVRPTVVYLDPIEVDLADWSDIQHIERGNPPPAAPWWEVTL